tara:strand:+ start:43 stop:237 length:195 start_codon:yes stop_codon:yes gene_type:complete
LIIDKDTTNMYTHTITRKEKVENFYFNSYGSESSSDHIDEPVRNARDYKQKKNNGKQKEGIVVN